MDRLTKQWKQAIDYENYREDRKRRNSVTVQNVQPKKETPRMPLIKEVHLEWLTKPKPELKAKTVKDRRLLHTQRNLIKALVDVSFDSQGAETADEEVKAAYLDTLRVLAQVSIIGLGQNLREERPNLIKAIELIKAPTNY